MKKSVWLFLFFIVFISYSYSQETVTIKGQVTDFEGNVIDSCDVCLLNTRFEPVYKTQTDSKGNYILDKVEKGKYMGMYAIRSQEYPTRNLVSDENKRLEYWAWNVIADRNLEINPRYHCLELYGTNVFKIEGAYPGMIIYTRPMSLGKFLNRIDKDNPKVDVLSVLPEHLKIKVFADQEELIINSVQPVMEYTGENNVPMRAFLISVSTPKNKPDKPYIIFRIEAENTEFGEKGENVYFYQINDYK